MDSQSQAISRILDSSALIAFLRDEPGAAVVSDLFLSPAIPCVAHSINLCEVFYQIARSDGEPNAHFALHALSSLGLIVHSDMDVAFWQDAGRIKATYRRVALADCLCLALARRLSGEVVTADHHEFDALVPSGLCPIRFIR